MVTDWLVGILGFVLVVGSMVVAIEVSEAPQSGDDATDLDGGPPPLLGQDSWTAEGCLSAKVAWEIPGDQASEHAEPWAPQDPARFVLWAYECETSVVSGIAAPSPISGGAAWIEVEAPEGNTTANRTDGTYYAQPEVFVGNQGELSQAFSEHGFEVTTADVSITDQDVIVGRVVTVSWSTGEGQIEARTTLSSSGQSTTHDLGLLAPIDATLGYQVGNLTATEVTTGTVTVTNDGETWYSRLGLSPTPDQVAIGQEASWDFTLLSRDLGDTGPDDAS